MRWRHMLSLCCACARWRLSSSFTQQTLWMLRASGMFSYIVTQYDTVGIYRWRTSVLYEFGCYQYMFSSFWWTKDTEGFLWSFVFGLLLFVRISARSFSLNAWFVDNCHGPFIYLQVVEICSLVIFRSLSMQTWDNCNVVIIRKILKVTKHWIWTLRTDILFCFWPHSWSMAFDVPSPYIHLIWPAQGHCVGMVGTSQPT